VSVNLSLRQEVHVIEMDLSLFFRLAPNGAKLCIAVGATYGNRRTIRTTTPKGVVYLVRTDSVRRIRPQALTSRLDDPSRVASFKLPVRRLHLRLFTVLPSGQRGTFRVSA
jgi:hypothetical protein